MAELLRYVFSGVSIFLPLVFGSTPPEQVCPTTLEEQILSRLVLSMERNIEMVPGGTRQMEVGTMECCYFFVPVDTCVTWSVEPQDGASIDEEGLLAIDPATPGGSVYVITADVEYGRRLVTGEVYVYDPKQEPLIGFWRETAQIDCAGGGEVAPAQPIGELRFFADGRVNVTWIPFEIYVDYWGTYTAGEDRALELVISGGNYVPPDLDPKGRYVIDSRDQLLLRQMWLGSPRFGGDGVNCGHRFTRQFPW